MKALGSGLSARGKIHNEKFKVNILVSLGVATKIGVPFIRIIGSRAATEIGAVTRIWVFLIDSEDGFSEEII